MSGFFFAFSATISVLCLIATTYAARSAVRALESLRAHPRYSESRIKSLETSVADLQSALTDVANRVKMMRVRNAANHVPDNGAADPYQQPDRWRAEINKQLAFGRIKR